MTGVLGEDGGVIIAARGCWIGRVVHRRLMGLTEVGCTSVVRGYTSVRGRWVGWVGGKEDGLWEL